MFAVDWLRRLWPLLLPLLYCATLLIYGSAQWDDGYAKAKSEGEVALADLELRYLNQALAAKEAARVQLLQQVTRANQAEELMLGQMDQHAKDKQQLQERIAYVTSHYLPTANAAPVAIPHCVFTAGWLRDYNRALGVPAAAASAVARSTGQAASTATDADAELLESGVNPADILAHAQDYGQWARNLASQVTALLTAREGCTP